MATDCASRAASGNSAVKSDPRIVGVKKHHKRAFELIHSALDSDGQGNKKNALHDYKLGLQHIVQGLRFNCEDPECDGPEWEKVRTLKSKMTSNKTQVEKRIQELETLALVEEAQHQVQNSRILGTRKPKSAQHHVVPSSKTQHARSKSSDPIKHKKEETAGNTVNKVSQPRRGAELLKDVDPNIRDKILSEIKQEFSDIRFDDIIGLEGAKQALREIVVLPALRPELFTGLRAPARGLLLFGPPGNGKTFIAVAIANESKSTFFNISASSLTSKYVGESEKLVRALFLSAKAMQPSIVFIDEIDSIMTKRSENEHEASRRIKTEFLVSFDGASSSAEERVLVMGATNLPHELDDAALRRFTKRIYIPMPGPSARYALVQKLLKNSKSEISSGDLKYIVNHTEGYSASDLTALTRDAALGPIRELGSRLIDIPEGEVRGIRKKDFVDALKNIRPSTSIDAIQVLEDWNKEFGTTA